MPSTILIILIINVIIINIFKVLMVMLRRDLLNGENTIASCHALHHPPRRRQAHLVTVMMMRLLVDSFD